MPSAPITTTISDELKARIRDAAIAQERSFSQMVKVLLEAGLKTLEKQE